MAVFEEVTLTWNESEYRIAPDHVMGAIARIEDVITLKELGRYAQKQDVPLAKIAMAYGALLRYAGAKAKDDEVYAAMFGSSDTQYAVIQSVETLLMMMIPPSATAEEASEGEEKKVNTPPETGGNNSSANASS